jgi:hypothetical protein
MLTCLSNFGMIVAKRREWRSMELEQIGRLSALPAIGQVVAG